MYTEIRQGEYGTGDAEGAECDLLKKLQRYEEQYPEIIKVATFDGKPVVAICTELMRRVHENWQYSKEMAFVDSTGNFDREEHRVFTVLTHSFAGALPLGILITSTEKAERINLGLKLVRELAGEKSFYGNNLKGPKVFMTDNSSAEKRGISFTFPSAVLLLCIFHILQAAWRFVWKCKKVHIKSKPLVYSYIKKLVYAETPDMFAECYTTLMENEIMPKSIKTYVKRLYAYRQRWALSVIGRNI